jgi:hypothetical protein
MIEEQSDRSYLPKIIDTGSTHLLEISKELQDIGSIILPSILFGEKVSFALSMNMIISQKIDRKEAEISARDSLFGFIETDPTARPPKEELKQQLINKNVREEDAKTLAETTIGKANLKMTPYPTPLADTLDEVTFGLDNSKHPSRRPLKF